MSLVRYSFFLVIPLSVFVSLYGNQWFSFTALLTAFGLLPFLELFLKPNKKNLDPSKEINFRSSRFFDLWLYLNIPIVFYALFLYLGSVHSGGLSFIELVGKTLAVGILFGVNGINVAHELGHRKEPYHQWMAQILLLSSLYAHFFIEHNRGHHLNVSTPEDPSSARYRESIYHFWWRSVTQTYLSAWHLDWKHMLVLQLTQATWVALLFYFFQFDSLFYLGASVIGFLLLESVNYIEHYGLTRNKVSETRYEKAKPQHSWNSNHPMGRLVLFELSRHSDHHYQPQRPYQILRHHDESPQMPTGYPGMILLALIPPLFFNVMDEQMSKFGLREQN